MFSCAAHPAISEAGRARLRPGGSAGALGGLAGAQTTRQKLRLHASALDGLVHPLIWARNTDVALMNNI